MDKCDSINCTLVVWVWIIFTSIKGKGTMKTHRMVGSTSCETALPSRWTAWRRSPFVKYL